MCQSARVSLIVKSCFCTTGGPLAHCKILCANQDPWADQGQTDEKGRELTKRNKHTFIPFCGMCMQIVWTVMLV
jgi:hypothetical protein